MLLRDNLLFPGLPPDVKTLVPKPQRSDCFQIAPVLARPPCYDFYHSSAFILCSTCSSSPTHAASSLNFLSWTSFSAVLTSTFSSTHASSINLSYSFISLNISNSVSFTLNLKNIPFLECILVSGGNWIESLWFSLIA